MLDSKTPDWLGVRVKPGLHELSWVDTVVSCVCMDARKWHQKTCFAFDYAARVFRIH